MSMIRAIFIAAAIAMAHGQTPPSPKKSSIPLNQLPSCKSAGNLGGKGWLRICENDIAVVSCPANYVITSVTSAFYGNAPDSDSTCRNDNDSPCQYTNLTAALSKRIVGLNNATLVVRGEILIGGQQGWLSDPCPTVGKSFNMTWCCGVPPSPLSFSPPLDSPPLLTPPSVPLAIDFPPLAINDCNIPTPCPKGAYYYCSLVLKNDTNGNGNQGGCRPSDTGPFPYGDQSYQCAEQCLRIS